MGLPILSFRSIIKLMFIVAGLIKAVQAVNGTTWHDTFLGLWIAALRLVQRVGLNINLILLL